MKKHHIIIIGGGGTGAAVIHDLQQRGFASTLVERGELTSGTTGRHHGQLHCGARYAVGDRMIARECMEETTILRRIAGESLESNYGLFVSLTEEDDAFAPTFIEACREAAIPARVIPTETALRMEPNLNPKIRMAVQVPDGVIDAWRLPLQFFATARSAGAKIHTFTPVTGLIMSGKTVTGVKVRNLATKKERVVSGDMVINATGAWASQITAMAGIDIPITPAPGTMVAVGERVANMVISRLHPAGDGDIIVPQRRLSIIGTTQWKTENPDGVKVPEEDIAEMFRCADRMIPDFSRRPFHAAWTASRPLAGKSDTDDGRRLSRDFNCVDHAETDGVEGLVSVIGGKATVLRAMAEKTVNLVCKKLGEDRPCMSTGSPLISHRAFFMD